MGWRLAFPALAGTGRLWKQGTIYSLVLGRVGSCACHPAEAIPHTAPGWAHVVCALYIPEVQFANVLTMEPIVLQYVPHDRFNKVSGPLLILPWPTVLGSHRNVPQYSERAQEMGGHLPLCVCTEFPNCKLPHGFG